MVNEVKKFDRFDTGPQGTRVLRREAIDLHIRTRRNNPDESPQGRSGAALLGLGGNTANQRFDIPAGRSTVGRNGNNAIVVDDDSVSLVHARIIQKDDEWWVLNLLSTNGTFVNDRKVTDARLHHGDHVRFGQVEFMFHHSGPLGRSTLTRLRALWNRLAALFRRKEGN
jgi:pSer/pThr/pTyr-binding forkhead associated (FHA) protein